MLTPRPLEKNPCYYHLVVNPQKKIYSARRRDTSWNAAGITVKSELTENKRVWNLHLAVPFKSLDVPPPLAGERWKILIGRGAETICSAKDYHDVSAHLPLIFAPAPKPPVVLNQVKVAGKQCTFDFLARNLPGQVKVRISSGTNLLREETVAISGTHLICAASLSNAVPLKGLFPIAVQLFDLQDRLLYERRGSVQEAAQKTLTLDAYYLLPGQRLGYKHDFGSGTQWQLIQDEKVIAEGAAGAEGKIVIPATVSGRLAVRFTAKDCSAVRVVYCLAQTPGAIEQHSGDLAVSADRRITRGGKPLYLLGLSFFRNSFYPFPPQFNFTSGGDGVAENAVKVSDFPGGNYQRYPFPHRNYGPIEKYLPQLEKFLENHNGCGKLHRICYEANIQHAVIGADGKKVPADSANYMRLIYQHAKKLYPKQLFSLQIDVPSRIPDYAASCDVMELACGSSSYGVYMIPSICENLEYCMACVPHPKPVILWLGGTIPNPVCRTAEELHAAIYLSMLHGTAGNIIHMGHSPMTADRKRIWSFLSGISREIGGIYPDIAAGKEDVSFLRGVPKQDFYWRAYRNGSKILLVMVNLSAIKSVCRTEFSDGKPFSASFTPYEVRVWRFQP